MLITDWVLICTALFLGACALFVPYFSELIKRYIFSPNLTITFDQSPPLCHKTFLRSKPDSKEQYNEPAYYFRFFIENTGKSTARQCEAVLKNIWIYDSANNPLLFENFAPVIVWWSGTSEPYVNINPMRNFMGNIGHISSPKHQKERERSRFIDIPDHDGNELRFMFDLHQTYYSQPNCLVPGKYILEFGIYSENAKYQEVYFNITWSGIWKNSESEMFKEIVISNTNKPTT
jgi:hypothetical protein